MRWPGVIKPGSVSNGIVHHMDMLPTFLAAAGKTDIKEDLLDGYSNEAMGRDYRVHLDGYDITEHLKDPQGVASPRQEIFYFSDTGDLTALRYGQWKLIFLQQKTMGTLAVWKDPWVQLRMPLIFNLRRDPYERAYFTSNNYYDWMIDKAYLLVPAQTYVGRFLATFAEYPPRMKPGSFSLDNVMEAISSPGER
jgi:arylsulfatase